jgi:RNA polymerase sigma-70 factor (ECF subfamily)
MSSCGDIESLYRAYGTSVFRVCRSHVRSTEDAQDVVHDVFLKVQKGLGQFQEKSAIFTWIYRITVNQCLEYRRRNYRRGNTLPLEAVDAGPYTAKEAGVESSMRMERIMQACDRTTRAIIFLLYYEGLTQEEVAEVLGMGRSAVTKRLALLKKKFSHIFPQDRV